MNILEAYDLTGLYRDAASCWLLASHGSSLGAGQRRGTAGARGGVAPAGVIDVYLEKMEELVERSKGKIRADKVHEKITAMGYGGRSARRGGRSRG